MFANLFHRRAAPPSDYEHAFVRDVQVRRPRPRNRAAERLLVWGWALIGVKSALVFWACTHYAIPVNPWWVIAPTIGMAILVTLIYRWRN